jgi:hypothetical protein
MSRLLNILLGLWCLALALFFLSNWGVVWMAHPVSFLFIGFEARILVWFFGLGVAIPIVIRLAALMESRALRRDAEGKINLLKSEAFDSLQGDPGKIVDPLRQRLETMVDGIIQDRLGQTPPRPAGEDSPPASEED